MLTRIVPIALLLAPAVALAQPSPSPVPAQHSSAPASAKVEAAKPTYEELEINVHVLQMLYQKDEQMLAQDQRVISALTEPAKAEAKKP